ncbi:MAG: FprA family A-type flavoprotein [Chloroflexota bacterium]|nr:MAG: FprA family A-type flavoprotein [Chloroflexota bacterium]
MKARKIDNNVFWVGAVDWDRRLFDSLIPLPDGTSYNSYLVRGSEKAALIDTVDPSMTSFLLSRLDELGTTKLDYLIANHAEQDHSGSLPAVVDRFPMAKVVTTPKGKKMLIDLLRLPEDAFITVEDGEQLSLGDKTLRFIHTPWVHWPETMVTYLPEDRILFSCDFFGSHLAMSSLYTEDTARLCEAAKAYYAQVMMPFRAAIRKNLEKIQPYRIDVIAPSHGPVHRDSACILRSHQDWVSDALSNSVVLPYISMHGSTQLMADHLADALTERGVQVQKFNLAVADTGKLAAALVDAATVVVGSPMVLAGAHPSVISAVFLANALRPKLRFASIIGSYGWGGKMVEHITGTMSNLKVELLEPVLVQGHPREEDLQALERLAEAIAAKHHEAGIG